MELNDWIDNEGGYAAAAEKLGEPVRTVRSWYYGERAPSIGAAVNVIKCSEHQVDFNGIYWPIARRLFGFEKPGK